MVREGESLQTDNGFLEVLFSPFPLKYDMEVSFHGTNFRRLDQDILK